MDHNTPLYGGPTLDNKTLRSWSHWPSDWILRQIRNAGNTTTGLEKTVNETIKGFLNRRRFVSNVCVFCDTLNRIVSKFTFFHLALHVTEMFPNHKDGPWYTPTHTGVSMANVESQYSHTTATEKHVSTRQLLTKQTARVTEHFYPRLNCCWWICFRCIHWKRFELDAHPHILMYGEWYFLCESTRQAYICTLSNASFIILSTHAYYGIQYFHVLYLLNRGKPTKLAEFNV